MMTRKYELRRKPRRAGILPVALLAGGLLLGGTGAGFELAAPSPVVHSATVAHDAPAVSWPQPGTPGGGPVTSTAAPASGTHSHPILRTAGRLALRHVFRVHGIYIRRHVLPWWLRRGGN